METETGDIWLKMMTAADVTLLALVRKIRRLLPLIMSARDLWKAVLVGLLLQLQHSPVEWALFDEWLWLFLWLPLRSVVLRPFMPHIARAVIKSDIESHG